MSDRERSTTVAEALRLADEAARAHDLTLTWELSEGDDGRAVAVHRATLSDSVGTVLGRAAGKGVGKQSLASALFEAYEHAGARGLLPRQRHGRAWEVLPPPDFEQFDLLSTYAHDTRPTTAQATVPFHALLDIHPVRTGRRIVYPAVAADFAYHGDEAESDLVVLERYSTTNGYAAGATAEDALVHAVNELVERDALSQHLLSSVIRPRPLHRIRGGEPPELKRALETVETFLAGEAVVVDVTAHTGCVVMAHLRPADSATALVGMGCSLFPDIAFERAVTELYQEWKAYAAGVTFADEGGREPDNLDSYPLLRRAAEVPAPRWASQGSYGDFLRDRAPNNPSGEAHLLTSLRQNGFEVFWRSLWEHTDDADGKGRGVHVVQVIAPGLEQFYGIMLCRPLVPVGRLYSPETCAALLKGVDE
ncbi:YcaO-like family protein [Streptomyces alkaliterrae]|uniref:YcaO-like family protein n=1 Tax=Streptomyces alkaliterrae TaxID=2213162 RepID=A0A7W3WN83_9ACTN|nr:YcaO-like family protein [Streptomyces alkaliterrae]MBB1255451.1 YcaO-like family protein [Streptomyces alkaliterrae]MBB1260643.1 YcaO-like family protein [Streptomyces alkaliterrae]